MILDKQYKVVNGQSLPFLSLAFLLKRSMYISHNDRSFSKLPRLQLRAAVTVSS